MNLPTVSIFPDIDVIPTPCTRLLEETSKIFIEGSLDWYRNLQRNVFANSADLCYASLVSGDRCLAVLPLRFVLRGKVRRVEALANYYTSLYTPAFADDVTATDVSRLVRTTVEARGKLDEVSFSPMDPASPSYRIIRDALRLSHWIAFRYFCFGNWYLKSPGSWSAYLKSRSAKFRSNVNRSQKKFDEAGGRLELVTDPIHIDHAVAAFQHVYSNSWKIPEPYPGFVPGLVRLLAESGRLRLGLAWLGNEPVAAQIWICNGRSASIFKVAYDERHSVLAPGTLLTAFLMRHVLDSDNVAEVDFLIGDDAYKRLWMSDRRERWGIVAYNPRTLIGCILILREISWRALKRLIIVFEQGRARLRLSAHRISQSKSTKANFVNDNSD